MQIMWKKFHDSQSCYSEALRHDYVFGKQTIFQLSKQYDTSRNTVQRKLDSIRVPRIISSSKKVVVLMDTTYWGRNFGVVVMKDWFTKRVLWRKFAGLSKERRKKFIDEYFRKAFKFSGRD